MGQLQLVVGQVDLLDGLKRTFPCLKPSKHWDVNFCR